MSDDEPVRARPRAAVPAPPAPPTPPPMALPPRDEPTPGSGARLMRIGFQAGLVWTMLLVVDRVATLPGPRLLLDLNRHGLFLPAALSTAAGIHAKEGRPVILLLVLLLLTIAWPFGLQDLPPILLPVGCGLLIGTLLRNAMRAAT